MKESLKSKFGQIVAMVLVTIFAVAAMLASNTRWFSPFGDAQQSDQPEESQVQVTAAPVSVRRLEKETVEITDIYSGMMNPFEQYTFAFEIAGRVVELGKNDVLIDLDEGDPVRAGDTLAVLDRRALLANIQETNARKEQTEEEYHSAEELRRRNQGALSETELRIKRSEMLVAQAQSALAQTNLDNATLICTIDGVISKRLVNPGESVNPQQAVFEVVQVDRMLLIVGAPESRVTALIARQRELKRRRDEVHRAQQLGQPAPYREKDLRFDVNVSLIGHSARRRQPAVLQGEVYRIGQTANDRTGLFQVEILLPNDDGLLRPGLVAIAAIVVDRLEAYRLPTSAALFLENKTYLFSVEPRVSDIELLFWKVGSGAEYRAVRWELDRENYLEQGSDLILFELPPQRRTVVVRGQRRLVDQRPVLVVPNREDETDSPPAAPTTDVRTAEAGS